MLTKAGLRHPMLDQLIELLNRHIVLLRSGSVMLLVIQHPAEKLHFFALTNTWLRRYTFDQLIELLDCHTILLHVGIGLRRINRQVCPTFRSSGGMNYRVAARIAHSIKGTGQ
jgi:hypothetical protein